MSFKLDVEPIPSDVLYVNDLSLVKGNLNNSEMAIKGITEEQGGVLPNDNVRIYAPIDINGECLISNLSSLFYSLGTPTENNEFLYSREVSLLIKYLEIYDQVWCTRDFDNTVIIKGKHHSKKAIAIATQMITILNKKEGCAELFPYDEIDELERFLQKSPSSVKNVKICKNSIKL